MIKNVVLLFFATNAEKPYAGADLRGGCRGVDLRLFNTTGILQKKKKTFWFMGVEVKHETRLKNLC